ncbi:MAG: hypothetical protein JO277_09780 [Candidatus Eremiobacteraeota bacterium]|nr:hypothetical protein [Candidatus Eremiobacteraeota bacterium]
MSRYVAVNLVLALATGTPSPAPVPNDWIAQLFAVPYTSSHGDAITLARAASAFGGRVDAHAGPPRVDYDRAKGLVRICFGPSDPPFATCGYEIYARGADVGVPAGVTSGSVKQSSIGLTLAQLLNAFRSDQNFAGKMLVKGASGDVVLVWALDEDPPPSRYDHGYQTRLEQLYFLHEGVVAAAAFQFSEN